MDSSRGTPSSPRLLRRVFPARSECPDCRHDRWTAAGSSRALRYRRCSACGSTYRVAAIAEEVDAGGAWSEVRGVR
jgi:transcription elongation factor Elf1